MARLQQISALRELATQHPPKTIVIAGGERTDDLEVYGLLQDAPFVERCLLVGDPHTIARSAGIQPS